jgi:hypothetical protein
MELCNFKGTLYGKVGTQFFVWESSWETFRPIERIGWNGSRVVIADEMYKEDIFSPYYGFGSPEMKKVCRRLTEITEIGVPESESIPWLDREWWRDRRCTFAFECSDKSPTSWLKYIKYTNSKPRTLRRHNETRKTKRILIS